MEKFENLLDKAGWKFEADYKSHYKGNVRINKGEIIVKDGYAFLKEGTLHMIPVVTGTPKELEFAGITNFRLLEPESKEEKTVCANCGGSGWATGPVDHLVRACPKCKGTGTIKPTVSKEEAERVNNLKSLHDLDLLLQVCHRYHLWQNQPNDKEIYDAYVMARKEMESRLIDKIISKTSESFPQSIRRETATQFACAIIKNSHEKNYVRNTVNDGWWGNHVLDEAIALTDELLKKLGE